MNTQQPIDTNCKICGMPATRFLGKSGRNNLCSTCANHTGRSDATYAIPTFELTTQGAHSEETSISSLETSSTKSDMFRLIATCSCGKGLDMGGQALGMTIACPDCGEKIILTDAMKKDPGSRFSKTLSSITEFEPSKYLDLPSERIGELMVEAMTITASELEEGLLLQQGQGGRLVDNLILLGYLDRDEFEIFLAKLTGIRSIVLRNCDLNAQTVALIPLHFGLEYEVCPIEQLGGLLTVGMACPHDVATLHKVEYLTRLKVTAFLCNANDIINALNRMHPQALPPCVSFHQWIK